MGGQGWAVRTTEYLINRGGLISTFKWDIASHKIEAGAWFENDWATQNRVWYPFAASSNDLTPYEIPKNQAFTQYQFHSQNRDLVTHIQDQWQVESNMTVQYGFKSSFQFAEGKFPINQQNAATNTNPTQYPSGSLNTREWFLPELGLVYDFDAQDHGFINIQSNMRHFADYGAGGSAWSQASQAAFNLFKDTVKPESSTTYETGLRSQHSLDWGLISGFEGQASLYHVDFHDRQLQISSTPVIGSLVAGATIITNVGSVKTDGADIAGTLHFGSHFSFYNALSYNHSVYQENYNTGANNSLVMTAGKIVPGDPEWMNKSVLSAHYGVVEGELSGDYVGKRFATYTNDLWVKSYYMTNLHLGYSLPSFNGFALKSMKLNLNVTNLGNIKGTSTLVVAAASGAYNTYPIPPRMIFINFASKF